MSMLRTIADRYAFVKQPDKHTLINGGTTGPVGLAPYSLPHVSAVARPAIVLFHVSFYVIRISPARIGLLLALPEALGTAANGIAILYPVIFRVEVIPADHAFAGISYFLRLAAALSGAVFDADTAPEAMRQDHTTSVESRCGAVTLG
jgi:hypothetical protein